MARKEAIEYIKGYRKLDENLHNSAPPNSVAFIATEKCLEYWDMAIEALEQEPCNDTVSRGVFEQVMWERDTAIEQLRKLGYGLGQKIEPCEDAVSRSALLEFFKDDDYVVNEINNMPSVLPKREQGEWIDCQDEGYVECPICGSATNCDDNKEDLHYCFSCGAEMR